MKRFLKISLCLIMTIVACATCFACDKDSDETDVKTGFTVRKIDGVYVVKNYVAEEGVDTLTIDGETVVGETYDGEDIKIASNAFKGNSSLKKIVVSGEVVEIGEGAFSNVKNLEDLELPFVGEKKGAVNNARLFGYIFSSAEYEGGLKITQTVSGDLSNSEETPTTATYYLPEKLNTLKINFVGEDNIIPDFAFSGMFNAVTEIEIIGDVMKVGKGAYMNSGIRKVNLPNTVEIIDDDAFSSCSLLAGTYYSIDGLYKIDLSSLDKLLYIGDRAFKGVKTNIITLPVCTNEETRVIGERAFMESSLKDVINLNYWRIKAYAFYNSSDLAVSDISFIDHEFADTAFEGTKTVL